MHLIKELDFYLIGNCEPLKSLKQGRMRSLLFQRFSNFHIPDLMYIVVLESKISIWYIAFAESIIRRKLSSLNPCNYYSGE